jgi:hypothetical protein
VLSSCSSQLAYVELTVVNHLPKKKHNINKKLQKVETKEKILMKYLFMEVIKYDMTCISGSMPLVLVTMMAEMAPKLLKTLLTLLPLML